MESEYNLSNLSVADEERWIKDKNDEYWEQESTKNEALLEEAYRKWEEECYKEWEEEAWKEYEREQENKQKLKEMFED